MMHHTAISDHVIGGLGHMMTGCGGMAATGASGCGGVVSGGAVRIEQHGNQIVHVRGDSDSDLEALFSVLNNMDGRGPPPTSSFKNRKLPASFFRQPDHKMAALANGNQQATVHGRSVSSPAQLHHGTSSGPTSTAGSAAGSQTCGKMAAGSASSAVDSFLQADMSIGASGGSSGGISGNASATCNGGWEQSKTCPRYYNISHGASGIWQQQQDVSAQQHMPMTSHPVYQQQGRSGNSGGAMPHVNGNGTGPTPVSAQADFGHHGGGLDPHGLGPLPQGWEQGITQDGEIYYINHIDKSTSWQDPRVNSRRQSTSSSSVRIGPGVHPMMPSHPHSIHLQQQQQQHGHMAGKQQQQPCQIMQTAAHHQMMANGGGQQVGNGVPAQRTSQNEHFICLELQKLHKEKERLQHEQEAINCRELMLNELVRQSSVTSPCGGNGGVGVGGNDGQMKEGALAMLHAMQSLYGTNLESQAFINQCTTGSTSGTSVIEAHARQNSTDSGLGGMGTAYSLPRSPDDYLSNVDEMEMQESLGSCMTNQAASSCYMMPAGQTAAAAAADLGLHPRAAAMHHMPSMCDILDVNGVMESDQLVCSLTGDVSSELLSEMDVQKMDRLLWL